LLRVYPRTFLIGFEDLLCQAFGDLSLRAMQGGGMWSLIALWARTLRDLFSSALAQHTRDGYDRRFKLSWIGACILGIPLGAGLVLTAYLPVAYFLWPSARALRTLILSNSAFSAGGMASLVSIAPAWLQSRVHRWKRFDRITWICSTILGVFGGWAAMSAFFSGKLVSLPIIPAGPLVHLVGFALCGSILGLSQMMVLANKTARAWAWLPACAVGMIVVGFETTAIEGLFRAAVHSHRSAQILVLLALTAALVGGAIFGLLTAKPLEWILEARNLTKDQVSRDKDSNSLRT